MNMKENHLQVREKEEKEERKDALERFYSVISHLSSYFRRIGLQVRKVPG